MNDTVINPLQPGNRVGGGRYLLKQILGRGGMGLVWLARDEKLNELVALKFVTGPLRHDPAGLSLLRREVGRAHRLTHPHILRVHDLHEHDGEDPFIAMEYVDGPTLAQLRAHRPQRVLPWSELAPLVSQLCAALAYAHGEGVVHRDLKPGNVMLDSRGRLKLTDFGIAALFNEQTTMMTGSGGISGTPAYMSPQQMNGERPSPSDDLYALGAMLYELLTSEPPFTHGHILHQVQHKEPPTLRQRLTDLNVQNACPPPVETAILSCLAKDPAKRPAGAMDLAARLTVPDGNDSSPAPAQRKSLVLLTVAAMLVAFLAIGGWIAWKSRQPSVSGLSSSTNSHLSTSNAALGQLASGVQVPGPERGADGRLRYPVGVWARVSENSRTEEWLIRSEPNHGPHPRDIRLMTNLGLRARFRGQRVKDWDFPQMNLRSSSAQPWLNLHIRYGKIQIRTTEAGYPVLAEAPLREPLPAGKEYDMEFYAIGSRVFGRVNGQLVTVTTDISPEPGTFAIYGANRDYFQNFHILNLDGLSEADALKAAGLPQVNAATPTGPP